MIPEYVWVNLAPSLWVDVQVSREGSFDGPLPMPMGLGGSLPMAFLWFLAYGFILQVSQEGSSDGSLPIG